MNQVVGADGKEIDFSGELIGANGRRRNFNHDPDKNFFIEGYFARLMYRSLYTMHEAALHGLAKVILGTIGRTFGRRNVPIVKLH